MKGAIGILLSAGIASACECRHLTECEVVQQPVIFIGKVVAGGVGSIRDDPWYTESKSVRFQVVEALRGLASGTKFFDLETLATRGMCSPNPYRPGRTYLVIPTTRNGKFIDGGCFSGRDVEYASDVIEYLRRHLKTPSQFHIRGRVAATQRKESALLNMGEATLLQGVKVSASAKGKSYSATTDAHGRYELAVPGPGSYSVEAALFPYRTDSASVNLPSGKACSVNDFGLLSNSSISGRVWDQRGQPVRHARVGLIDLNHSSEQRSTRAYFRTAYPEQPDGSFLFENVPLGRYLLVFNPDGPEAEGFRPFPFESTFHPSGSARAHARTIQVSKAGMRLVGKDLIIGPRVAFRPVNVKVRFSDGSLMAFAVVSIVGEPLDLDGIAWRASEYLRKGKHEVHFQVPVNRKFRISVSDAYNRDLKKTYESTHDPGATSVEQEFVIAIP